MKNKTKVPFNPDDFDTSITVKELTKKFTHLLDLDYKKVSLANEIIPLNYEIISKDYVDFFSSDIKDYFDFEVDAVI
ncbi:MAG: hypothetical protein U5K55_01660 [Aliarcobacter sp.]|nr:hypothetical protein [Aliarcobacter sp.]